MSVMERLVLAVLMMQQFSFVEGKVQKGTITLGGQGPDSDNWQFVSKFGYSIGTGEYQVRFRYPENMGGRPSADFSRLEFNVFLDEEWPKVQVRNNEFDVNFECTQRNTEARKVHDAELPFESGTWGSWALGTVHQNVRPHIWYFVASKCQEDLVSAPLVLEYEIHLTQFDGSEFSIEMRRTLPLNVIGLLVLGAFVVSYCMRCKVFVSSAGKLHEVIIALSMAIFLQFVAQCLLTAHLCSYQSNGAGIPLADLLSEVLFMLSQVVETSLLIAIAMGYTLLPSANDSMVIVSRVTLLSLGIHASLVSFGKLQDESHSKYHENEGPIGWVLLSVRLMLFVWFVFATQATQQHGGLRLQDFLHRFRLAGSTYFLAYPLLFVIVQLFAPYLQHTIQQIGLLIMQTASTVWLAELFLSRGTYFKVSALSSSLLPGSHASFDKMS